VTRATHWYTAGVAFRTGMADEMEISISLVALSSASVDDARSKAEELGRTLATSYEWEFEGVIDVYEVSAEQLQDGVELRRGPVPVLAGAPSPQSPRSRNNAVATPTDHGSTGRPVAGPDRIGYAATLQTRDRPGRPSPTVAIPVLSLPAAPFRGEKPTVNVNAYIYWTNESNSSVGVGHVRLSL
jgi:hypothetical protein